MILNTHLLLRVLLATYFGAFASTEQPNGLSDKAGMKQRNNIEALKRAALFRPWAVLGINIIVAMSASTASAMTKKDAMECVTPGSAAATKPPCDFPGNELKFAMIGDWGGKATVEGPENVKVYEDYATLLQKLHAAEKFDFILNVGDTFYPYWTPGRGATDEFKDTWARIDPGDKVVLPFFSMLGNHDYINIWGIKQQTEQTDKAEDKRWIMPERYYSINIKMKNDKKIKFIMLDTQLLCGVIISGGGTFRPHGREHMHPHRLQESIAQEQWMLNQIQEAYHFDYVYIVGHYPVANVVTDFPEIPCMVRLIPEDLLKMKKISAYLSGHEHLLQHLVSASDVHYVLSGEGYDIHKLKQNSIKKYKDYTTSFFHGRVQKPVKPEDITAPEKIFKDVKDNKPGMVIATVTAANTRFDFVDSATEEMLKAPLHRLLINPRDPTVLVKEQAGKPALQPALEDNSLKEKRALTKKGAPQCVEDWKKKLKENKANKGKDPIVFKHVHMGEIGCFVDLEKPIMNPSGPIVPVLLTAGANRVKLFNAPATLKETDAMPIYECWKCTVSQKEGEQPTFKVDHAFCHLDPNRLKRWDEKTSWYGLLPYNRYIERDGFRYSCTGLPVQSDNNVHKGVMVTTPCYGPDVESTEKKPLVPLGNKLVESADGEFAGFQIADKKDEYTMSEDAYFKLTPQDP